MTTMTPEEAVLDSFKWLYETGQDMVKRYKLIPQRVNSEIAEQLKADILLSPNDKLLNAEVAENREYLKANYPLDRLQWIVQFSELYFDVGNMPQRIHWWSLYKTILGRPPEDLVSIYRTILGGVGMEEAPRVEGVSWYWVVRRYYRQYDKEYVDQICRLFFGKYPEAIIQVGNLEIPEEFTEVSQEIAPDELYAYWKRLYARKGELV